MISKKMLLDNTGKDISAKLKKMNYNLITYLKNDNDKSISELISGNIQEFEDENIINIKEYLFRACRELTKVNLPKCITIGVNAFRDCTALSNVNLPECEEVGTRSFLRCTALSKIIFQKIKIMQVGVFEDCSNLETLIIKNDTRVCSMYRQGTTDALSGTKIESGNGYIYVPDKLVQQYKREYNWVKYANQIKPLSEYTE